MKILVIGGSGFVGTRLLSELKKMNVLNLDKKNSNLFEEITVIHDIRNTENLDSFFQNVNIVVLLAAEHKDNISPISLYYDVNVVGTKNVLNAMDKHNVKNLIFTSSVAIYGLNKNNPNENSKADPFNHYGKSKWQAEMVIKNWYISNKNNKSVCVIRPTVIFGENNRGNVYNLFRQISSGNFVMIGSGENKKSMAYVGNVVAFIKNRIHVDKSGYFVYNYVDKPDLNMIQLINLIQNQVGSTFNFKIPYIFGLFIGYFFDLISFLFRTKLSVSSVRVRKFCANTQYDSSKLLLEFTPPYKLEESICNTLDFEFGKKE